MVIGVLGKGGSGKSTVSTNLVRFLASQEHATVLAIDADHNMDLAYNLGAPETFPYLGSSMPDLKKIAGLSPEDNYREALLKNTQGLFSLDPKDAFTETYATNLSGNLSLMAAGPQTDDVLADRACSHVLFTALKVYLPLLSLRDGQWVVVDEKAGADGASTGIPTGFDVALVVSEPTVHGMKTARQIASLLDHYEVPYEFVMNKVMEQCDDSDVVSGLGKAPIATIGFDQSFSRFDGSNISPIVEYLLAKKPSIVGRRYERSRRKFDTRQI